MCPNIFRFPFVENRPRALGATSFISLVFHGLLLGATGLAIPLKTATPPEETGISIDLASIVDPAPVQDPAKQEAPKQEAPAQVSGTAKAEAPKPGRAPMPKKAPKPNPRKAEAPMPRKAAAKNDAPGRATPSGAMQPDRKAEQVASKAPIGESSPPAPAGGSGKPRPQYPELARKRGQEGTVSVRCQVDANGHVTNVSLARSSGFRLLDEAALKAVGKWKFKPGRKDGACVAGTVVVPVQFRLQ